MDRVRALVTSSVLLGGCAATMTVHLGTPPGSDRPLASCAAPATPPEMTEPRFLPTTTGELELLRASGDPRLSAEGGILDAWSPDGEVVAFTDHGAVTVWRAKDGVLLDLIRCAPGDPGSNAIALSPDLRWVVVSGVLREPAHMPVTCIVDRESGGARLVDGETESPEFSRNGRLVYGKEDAIEVETGERREIAGRPARPPWLRYLVLSRRCIPSPTPSTHALGTDGTNDPSNYLRVIDRTTNQELWRAEDPHCNTWRLSPDGRFLEKSSASYGTEIYHATTGQRVSFPGGLLEIAPDGNRVVVLTATGPELWSIDPQRPILAGARYREVLAQSGDGRFVVAQDGRQAVLESAGQCRPLLAGAGSDTLFVFNREGTEIYGADSRRGTAHRVWDANTGRLVGSLYVDPPTGVYPMPDAGRVGFAFDGGIRVYDALRGTWLMTAAAPRTRYARFDALGQWRPVRDHHGNRPDQLSRFVTATRDGRYVVGGTSLDEPAVTRWDLQQPERVVDVLLGDSFATAALSPDERWLAAGDQSGNVYLRTPAGRILALRRPSDEPVRQLAFSPDSTRLAAAYEQGSVLLFDTANGHVRGSVKLASQRATFLWWSPDGARLVIDTTRHLRFELSARAGRR